MAGVEVRRLQLTEGLCRDDEKEAAGSAGEDLEAAIGRGDCRGDDLTVAHERDGCAGDFGAGGIGDDAANGSGARQAAAQNMNNAAVSARDAVRNRDRCKARAEFARREMEFGM